MDTATVSASCEMRCLLHRRFLQLCDHSFFARSVFLDGDGKPGFVMGILKLPVDSPVPETAILGLLQARRFLSGQSAWGFYLLAWFLGSPWLNRVTESASAPYLVRVLQPGFASLLASNTSLG